MTQENYERLEKFLKEQMTPEESDAYLNDLKNDKDLCQEAQMMALMIKEMKEEQTKQDAEIIEEVLSSKKKAKIIQITRWALSVAAMFILIFGATTLWNRQSDTDTLFAQYYKSYDTSLARGGDDAAINDELATLYNKVGTDKDLSSVIYRLQTIYDNIISKNEEYEDYKRYKNDIAWYLTLAYLKDHNIEKAKELLKPLADNGDGEAKLLLKDLNDL